MPKICHDIHPADRDDCLGCRLFRTDEAFRRAWWDEAVDGPYAPHRSGWGDLVAWAARWTGAAWLVRQYELYTGRPCGCQARQSWLNRLPGPYELCRRIWRRNG